jgi:LAO/AO transport system kinase
VEFVRERSPAHPNKLFEGIRNGDKVALGRSITLIESQLKEHQERAIALLDMCLPFSGKSIRIAVSGAPGVGKSTFIETLGNTIVSRGRKVVVLAIDPSSTVSKGAILGDKTRMTSLSSSPSAFIRPSAAGSTLGGVAARTRETIILCEAAGYDVVIIETVGVGQSETHASSMVDFFLLLIAPGAGDELQGIKRGIVELADLIAINKADGERKLIAKQTQQSYRIATHLFQAKENGWRPTVELCSALENTGIDRIWGKIMEFQDIVRENGSFENRRRNQKVEWLEEELHNFVLAAFHSNVNFKNLYTHLQDELASGNITIRSALRQIQQKVSELIK